MAFEHERKFLLKEGCTLNFETTMRIVQNYVETVDVKKSVRIRVKGEEAFTTFKHAESEVTNLEYESPMELGMALDIMRDVCDGTPIHKLRGTIKHEGLVYEVDKFMGENEGLVLVEVETPNKDTEINLPHFIGHEVTDDMRFRNAYLAKHPFKSWVFDEPTQEVLDEPNT